MNDVDHCDLVIVGGGMVGASLAIALAGRGLDIVLVEAFEPGGGGQPSYDDRAIALAHGTRLIFGALDLWPDLAPLAEPIDKIHVSDRGHCGVTRLSAADEGVPALGYVVTARDLGQVLNARLRDDRALRLIAPARVIDFTQGHDGVTVAIERDGVMQSLHCRLLVAADGGNSRIRQQLAVPVRQWRYGQSAVVANITPSRPHRGVAYERFTDAGPVALLPMGQDRCALVWTVADSEVEAVLAWDDQHFIDAFQARFGQRLGRFIKVGRRAAYPLGLLRARQSVRGRVAIIGNAAHTLHPIAGQGFNLGIRDVAALAEVVADAHAAGRDVGGADVLADYARWRSAEQRNVAIATDSLVRLFINPLRLVRAGRNIGLLAMEALPGLKHPLARAAMGLNGRQPRLARGVPLD